MGSEDELIFCVGPEKEHFRRFLCLKCAVSRISLVLLSPFIDDEKSLLSDECVQYSMNRDSDQPDAAEAGPAGDELLLKSIRSNDQNAMAALLDRYGSMVYSVALRVLKDPGHAEDVMQEILFQVWKDPNRFVGGRGSLGARLAVVTRNRAIDSLRAENLPIR
jgi:hypothetical protein